MGKIKTLKDIEQEKEERERNEFKDSVSKDMRDIFGRVFKKEEKPIKRKRKIWKVFKWLGILFLLLFLINLVLGNIWLLRALAKSLFGI